MTCLRDTETRMSALTEPVTTPPPLPAEPSLEPGHASTLVGAEKVTVLLQGEIDLALTPVLAEILAKAPALKSEIVVDASAVTFADCTLLSFLLPLSQLTRLTLKPSPAVRDLLLVAGLSLSFAVDD
jgi:anti-anti-sigma regulatory factor